MSAAFISVNCKTFGEQYPERTSECRKDFFGDTTEVASSNEAKKQKNN